MKKPSSMEERTKQTLALYKSYIPIAIRSIVRKRHVKDIRVMLLTIGFARSGSSLLGFLLTAHPNIVVADEPRVVRSKGIDRGINKKYPNVDILYKADNLNEVFNHILEVDYQRLQNKKNNNIGNRAKRYVAVSNQYQGRFKKLKVIGIKRSQKNTLLLSNINLLSNFKNKLEKRKISLKFIFTIRNPYDMVSTASSLQKQNLEKYIKKFTRLCNINMKLLQQIHPKDIFICRHEDTLKDPNGQLAKLCDFLQVLVTPDYLDDCASQIVSEPHKSRLKIDWSQEQKQKIASLIEKYDFLSEYNWES